MSTRYSRNGCSVIRELKDTLEDIGKKEEDVSWYALLMKDEHFNTKKDISIRGESLDLKELEKSGFPLYYDDGYGTQYLHGVVVFNDGTWLERGEYDGSEWWEYKCTPKREDYSNLKNMLNKE